MPSLYPGRLLSYLHKHTLTTSKHLLLTRQKCGEFAFVERTSVGSCNAETLLDLPSVLRCKHN